MKDAVLSITAAELCIIILTLILAKFNFLKNDLRPFIKKSIISGGAAVAVLILYNIIMPAVTEFKNPPSIISISLSVIICYFAFVISGFIAKEKLKKFIKGCGIICIIVFLAESMIFNFKSFTSDKTNYSPVFSDAQTNNPSNIHISDNEIIFEDNGTVTFNVYKKDINALKLVLDGTDNWFKCKLAIKDENFSKMYINVGEKFTSAEYENCDFSFNSYGELKTVQLTLSDVNGTVKIKSCTLYSALPFSFSNLRFLSLLAIFITIYAICSFKLYKVIYNNESYNHRFAVSILLVLCTVSMLIFLVPSQPLEYSNLNIAAQDPYIQMFDAVKNGRVNIDIEPSQELLEMENPYDYSLRAEQKVTCSWDRAYYNGKYYSYYGIAPVLTFYYPFYLITGMLPTINMASVFFAVLSVIFLFGTILSFVKRFIKKPNFLLLLLTMLGACFTTGIYFAVDFSNMYLLPGIASTCFLMLCLWCGFGAGNQKSRAKHNILLAVCGVAFVLCLASRPTKALSALILAPVFIGILADKNSNVKRKIISVVSFIIPVAIGLCGIMVYNYARFDSPFEFGAAYQLTVSDVHANGLNLSLFPYAIMHYFFQPLNMSTAFPFFSLTSVKLANYGQYIYNDSSTGIISFPMLFLGLVILPFLLYETRRRKGEKYIYNDTRIKNYTYLTITFLAVMIAWLNFCMAGIILSYVVDILPILSLLAIFVILDAQHLLSKIPAIANKSVAIFSATAIFTIFIVVGELLTLHNLTLYRRLPNIMFVLEDLICFWN